MPRPSPISGPHKAHAAKHKLRLMARKIGPAGKLPTVNELCTALSISKVTLGSVLKDLEGEGIVKGRRGSGIYVSPDLGRKTVAIVLGQDIFATGVSPINRILLDRFRDADRQREEAFRCFIDLPAGDFLAHGIDSHRELQTAMENHEIDCLIALGLASQKCEWIAGFGVPFIMTGVEGEPPLGAAGRVLTRYGPMAGLGVEALVGLGSRRIGLITPLAYLRSLGCEPDDVVHFRAAASAVGLALPPQYVWNGLETAPLNGAVGGESMEEAGYRAVHEMFKSCEAASLPRPDGLVILDDMMTRGAIVAAAKLGARLHKDLRIATHANKGSPSLAMYSGTLALMQIDPNQIADKLLVGVDHIVSGERSIPDEFISASVLHPSADGAVAG
jgi:DNA-binding LacI/PurR family transcriptional regulator